MDQSSIFLGIDYHKDQLQLCALDPQGKQLFNRSCPNDLQQLIHQLPQHTPIHAAIETAPGAAQLSEALTRQSNWSVSLAHAAYVARLRQSPDKTDYSDARMLADLNRVGYLPKVWLAALPIRELRQLVKLRAMQVKRSTSIKLQIRAILRDHRIDIPGKQKAWSKAWLEKITDLLLLLPCHSRFALESLLDELHFITGQVNKTTRRLSQIADRDPVCLFLMDQPGVGIVTATALRAAVGRVSRFTSGKALARYCGMSPKNHASGNKQITGGLIGEVNRSLRCLLIEQGWRLSRCEGRWKTMYQQMCGRGKHRCVAVAGVTNRWLRCLYHRWSELEESLPGKVVMGEWCDVSQAE